jgi:Leucine-rich repeat (LRR) protein
VPAVDGSNFSPLTPEIKLFLFSNALSSVPGEIFNIEHLTFLSLRDNQIKELPTGIGKLRNLRDLNISSNALRYLPFELLQLLQQSSSLRMLNIHPNPFYEPECPLDADGLQVESTQGSPTEPDHEATIRGRPQSMSDEEWSRKSQRFWETTHRHSSLIRFFDSNGSLLSGPELPHEASQPSNPVIDVLKNLESKLIAPKPQYVSLQGPSRPVLQLNTPPRSKSPVGNRIPLADFNVPEFPPTSRGTSSNAPSLLETALRTAYKSSELPSLPSLLPYDAPPHLSSLLRRAHDIKESGGQKCTICRKDFVVKRTEWIEWWEIKRLDEREKRGQVSVASPLWGIENSRDRVESLVPLIRRGCSWRCLPTSRKK